MNDKQQARTEKKAREATRSKKRRELFDAQDTIDEQRDGLIGKIEKQLKQWKSVEPQFIVRWILA